MTERPPSARTGRARAGLLVAVAVGTLLGTGGAPTGDAAAGAPGIPAQDATAVTQPPPEAVAPLPVLDAAGAPAVDPQALATALGPLVADSALGPNPGVAVVDSETGQLLYDARAGAAVTPASSLKIVTALSVLDSYGPQTRFATSVVAEADGSIVLVGGGDPSLVTVPPDGADGDAAGPASLADLADLTAAALAEDGTEQVALRYDAGLFTGAALHPDWDPAFVGLGIVSPVSALAVDPDSEQIDTAALDADPAATSANWFAARLRSAGVTVTGVGPGAASAAAAQLASVESLPLSALVDRMLNVSDNDVAEALSRLAAVGRGLPATFQGGAESAAATLAELDIPAAGLVLRDGSGLSRLNRIAPATLATALQHTLGEVGPGEAKDSDGAGPMAGAGSAEDTRNALTWVPPGLPVGGLTGSLAGRYATEETAAGAGRVRAKTGTLTGVTSLTGVVETDQGRPLVFAVLGNGTTDTLAARTALDRVAAGLAACGCEAPTA